MKSSFEQLILSKLLFYCYLSLAPFAFDAEMVQAYEHSELHCDLSPLNEFNYHFHFPRLIGHSCCHISKSEKVSGWQVVPKDLEGYHLPHGFLNFPNYDEVVDHYQ